MFVRVWDRSASTRSISSLVSFTSESNTRRLREKRWELLADDDRTLSCGEDKLLLLLLLFLFLRVIAAADDDDVSGIGSVGGVGGFSSGVRVS